MKQKGISLLEALLALVIASIIITLALRYFSITIRDMRVTQAVNQVRSLVKKSYDWLGAQKQADFNDYPKGTKISLQILINAGLIQTDNNGNYFNPWGGDVLLAPGSDPSYVHISLTRIPLKDCLNLTQRLQSINHMANQTNTCTDNINNTYEGEF